MGRQANLIKAIAISSCIALTVQPARSEPVTMTIVAVKAGSWLAALFFKGFAGKSIATGGAITAKAITGNKLAVVAAQNTAIAPFKMSAALKTGTVMVGKTVLAYGAIDVLFQGLGFESEAHANYNGLVSKDIAAAIESGSTEYWMKICKKDSTRFYPLPSDFTTCGDGSQLNRPEFLGGYFV